MNKYLLKLDEKTAASLNAGFIDSFGYTPMRYFSAPGRTEIGGNHTDHQRGRVLAGAVNLDTVAAVAENGLDLIRIQSEGYPMTEVLLDKMEPDQSEFNTTTALVRGVVARFIQMGCKVNGFDAYVKSTVLAGSGLSSSAAFEVLIGTIINHMFFDGKVTQPEVAKIGQYAENVFFGKPCGLMDQTASAVGGLVTINFFDKENPVIEPIAFDFAACGHALCIIDSRASHADLTDEYAAITIELKKICSFFDKDVLTQIDEADFYASIPQLRERFGDRAVMRAIHFYAENHRVMQQVEALKNDDFATFLRLIKESGYSSYMYLQNVIPSGYKENQNVAMALALCEHFLKGQGAFRVHGGGFAGTVQAFVPYEILDEFCKGIDGVLGEGACHVLTIRPQGGVIAEV